MSLFSIPGNKRFVFFNNDKTIREDPLLKFAEMLSNSMEKSSIKGDSGDELDDLRPYKVKYHLTKANIFPNLTKKQSRKCNDGMNTFQGFGKPLRYYKNSADDTSIPTKKRNFFDLLKEHVQEALQSGFDDSMSKFKGKSHFRVILFHKIILETREFLLICNFRFQK